ncbi:MAG TPA: DsbA family oxidoreductase [Solirubrobacteraceae bacterium]|nr:DsbA family oxidoreductase [Solirubrobacteraceae bacterium]
MEVEIWSDIACPWCYIGKRHFEAALSAFEHAEDVNVTWRSFELDPSAPPEIPGSSAEMLARKYGMSAEQVEASQARLTQMAAAVGLDYHLDSTRMGSTFDGHRLVQLARRHGLQDAVKERLLRARLIEGRLISDPETLLSVAAEVGVPEDEVRAMLASDDFADEVRADERAAQQLGISGVPMFVLDRRFGASGAQPPEQLLALLRHGWDNGGADQSRSAA